MNTFSVWGKGETQAKGKEQKKGYKEGYSTQEKDIIINNRRWVNYAGGKTIYKHSGGRNKGGEKTSYSLTEKEGQDVMNEEGTRVSDPLLSAGPDFITIERQGKNDTLKKRKHLFFGTNGEKIDRSSPDERIWSNQGGRREVDVSN